MAQYDGTIRINTKINTNGIDQGISGITKSLGKISKNTTQAISSLNALGNSVKKLGSVIATVFAAKQIIQFGKEALEAASDLEAVESQFAQVFGNLADEAGKSLSEIASQSGILENRMKASYTKIAAFAKTTGMDTADSLDLANRAMVAVADSAAFYDRSLEETTESLQSFLKGNYENDAALGLSATEYTRNAAANKLYGKSFIELSEAQKQLTLLQMVEDANALSGALGQAAREADTWTNQIGNLSQAWKNLKANLGKIVLPMAIQAVKMITNVINALNAMLAKLSTAAGAFRSFSELLTGKKSQAGTGVTGASQDAIPALGEDYNTAASGAENLASATQDAAEATKEAEKAAKGYLSPLDEIHKIGKEDIEVPEIEKVKDKVGDTGGADGIAGVPVDYGELAKGQTAIDELSDKFSGLYDLIKKKDWEGLGRSMASGINTGLRKIYDALDWNKIGPTITKTTDAFTRTINSMVENIDWDLLGRDVGRGIDLLAKTFNQLTDPKTGINFEAIGRSLSTALRGMLAEVDWRELGNAIGNYFMISWNLFKGFVDDMWRTSDLTGLNGWQELGRSLAEGVEGLFEKIDFKTIGITVAKAFNGIFETLKSFVLEMNNNGTWDKIAKNIYTGLNTMIHKIDWAENGRILSDFVVDLLGTIWKVAENTDWEGLGKGIGDFLSNINWGRIFGQVFAIIAEVVGGLIKGFGSTTAGKFVLAFGAVKLAIKSVKLVGAIKGVLEKLEILGNKLIMVGDKAAEAGMRAAGSRVNWNILRKAIGKCLAILAGFKIGMKLTEVEVGESEVGWSEEVVKNISNLTVALEALGEQGVITADKQETLNNTLSELVDKGASPTETISVLSNALSDAGVSSSDLSIAAQNAGVDLNDLINCMKGSEGGGEAVKSSLDKASGAAKTAGTDFENLAGKAQGTTSILNSLDTSPAQSNIESIQQSVDKVDFEKLSRNSEAAIRNMDSVWNSNKLPIYNTIKEALIDNIQFDDLLKTKYSGYAAFSVEGYNSKIKELEGETKTTMQSFAQKGIMDPVTGKLRMNSPSKVFEGYGENIVSGLKNGIGNLWGSFSDWWGTKVSNILDKFKGIKKSFEEKGNEIISGIQTGVSEKWSELSDALTGKKNNIVNTFSNIREEMKDIGSNIINGIIDGLNSMWSHLSDWVRSIKDALTFNISSPFGGGGTYSVNTPIAYAGIPDLSNIPIPHLAQGTIVPPNREFMAVLGDNTREHEVVSPLSTIKEANKEALLEVLSALGLTGGGGNGETIVVKLVVDGRTLADVVVNEGKVRQMSTGQNMFALGGI